MTDKTINDTPPPPKPKFSILGAKKGWGLTLSHISLFDTFYTFIKFIFKCLTVPLKNAGKFKT